MQSATPWRIATRNRRATKWARGEFALVLDDVRTYSLLGGRALSLSKTRTRLSPDTGRASRSIARNLFLFGRARFGMHHPALEHAVAQDDRQGGQVISRPAKGQALQGWMVQHARDAYEKQLDRQAAWRLADLVGTSLGALDAELSKLSI